MLTILLVLILVTLGLVGWALAVPVGIREKVSRIDLQSSILMQAKNDPILRMGR